MTNRLHSIYPRSAKALDAAIVAAALAMIWLCSSLERANHIAGDPLPPRNGGKLRVAARQAIELEETRQLEALYEAFSSTEDESQRAKIEREIDAYDAARQDRIFMHIAFSELRRKALQHALLLPVYSFGIAGTLWLRFHICRLAPHPILSVGIALFAVMTGAMAWTLALGSPDIQSSEERGIR